MPRTRRSKRLVVVTGDVTMDWNLARTRRAEGSGAAWSAEDTTEGYLQLGGAALLADLVQTVVDQLPARAADFEVRRAGLPNGFSLDAPDFHHSFAIWSPHDSADTTKVWRVKEYLGLDRPSAGARAAPRGKRVVHDPVRADLVILDDADLGFRDDPELWPRAIETPTARQPLVLLKMAGEIARGELWKHLLQNFAERLIVVMTINDLRLSDVQISRALSWERTAEDLAAELVSNPRVNALSQCAHVVVSLNTDGALLLSRREEPGRRSPGETRPQCDLVFDPQTIEGMWETQYPGGMVGYTACLTAGIARELMLAPANPNVARGVTRGLGAMRELHLAGYGVQDPDVRADLKFPYANVGKGLRRDTDSFHVEEVPPTQDGSWRILEARYPEGLEQVARKIAEEGADVTLEGVPLGRFGKLLTVDRAEIEGYQSIRSLIQEYSRGRPTRPLSIAVFGPPGSGKSFGIVELAKSLRGAFQRLDFNLSQLNEPSELHDALHQVRDVGLAGLIPLVFWDEFDTRLRDVDFGWLRHFLVPMQDGKFQEGQATHPIGPAVFVFAGGTSFTMDEFATKALAATAAKGRDFLSRLKGFVDVLGPNPRNGNEAIDPYYLIRRAILLRSVLLREEEPPPRHSLFELRDDKRLLQIDSGVLRAFLETREYRHGARSLESIVAMSLLHDKTRFERSALPAAAQLNVHVDADDFLKLAQRHEPEEETLDALAEAAHVVYCEARLEEGYRWGEPDDAYLKAHGLRKRLIESAYDGTEKLPALVSWQELSLEDKDQNRAQVLDIPSRLEALGYVMRKARGRGRRKSAAVLLSGSTLERLAEQEHERWMRARLRARWRYGAIRNNRKKLHPAIVSWHALSPAVRRRRYEVYADRLGPGELAEADREKDRDAVREMARIVAAAGYEIVKVREPGVIVGVTGHRFLAEVEKVDQGIRKALEGIERTYPGKPLTVMSALAEGADRLVVESVLARSTGGLVAVLPLAAADYENDFEAAESKVRFRDLLAQADETIELPPANTRPNAYNAGGNYILDHCDVLVAVWDGKGAQGRGGTAELVERARKRGLPVAWVRAGNRKPGTNEPTSLGAQQGSVRFERLAPG